MLLFCTKRDRKQLTEFYKGRKHLEELYEAAESDDDSEFGIKREGDGNVDPDDEGGCR